MQISNDLKIMLKNYTPVLFISGNIGDCFTKNNYELVDYLMMICAEEGFQTEYFDVSKQYDSNNKSRYGDDASYKYRQIDECCLNRVALDEYLCEQSDNRKATIIRVEGGANEKAKELFLKNIISMRFIYSSRNKLVIIGKAEDLDLLKNIQSAMCTISIPKPDKETIKEYIENNGALKNFLNGDKLAEFIRLCSSRHQREIKNSIDLLLNTQDYDLVVTYLSHDNISENNTIIKLNDVIGLDEAKAEIYNRLILPFKKKESFKKKKIVVNGGCLLYGLPGVGKTMFVNAVANEYDAVFYNLKMSDILSIYFGETEARIHEVFASATRQKLAIIFIDEVDAITPQREGTTDVMQRVISQLLIEMQNAGPNILVVGASNKPWCIDSAFLRSQRFTNKIYVPLPTAENRAKLLKKLVGDYGKDINFDKLSEKTYRFNNADIAELYNAAAINSVLRSNGFDELITMTDFAVALEKIHSTVDEADIVNMKHHMQSRFKIMLDDNE